MFFRSCRPDAPRARSYAYVWGFRLVLLWSGVGGVSIITAWLASARRQNEALRAEREAVSASFLKTEALERSSVARVRLGT